jgi:membrane fusion protein (multidrug efflux system)
MKKIKSITITLAGMILVLGIIVTVKGLQIGRMTAHGAAFVPPPETVSAAQASSYEWESVLTAVGSLQSVQGVVVSAELPGRVTKIAFEAGTRIAAGSLLLQQDISAELADQRSAQSQAALARKNYERTQALIAAKVVSNSVFDDNKAAYEKAVAQLDSISAAIEKKTIKAPFAGRLGIRQVNLGEILEPGQPIVSLHSLDPIYINFLLPQQQMAQLKNGLPVRVTTDSPDGREILGTITAINSEVDSASRNIRVQATLKNPAEDLKPGMYANVAVILPEKKPVVAIPITAVLYAPYSDSVFVIEDKGEGKTVRQQFIELGEKHGDLVAVHSGLKTGDTVVSTGVFKLRNGQSVVVDNTVSPEFQLKPRPDNA